MEFKIENRKSKIVALLVVGLLVAAYCLLPTTFRLLAQNQPGAGQGVTNIQLSTPYYTTTAISSTAAVNTATTLTIPAPAGGQYNYVCSLAYDLSASSGGAAATSVGTGSSTNFNGFATKTSYIGTASTDSGIQMFFKVEPGFGCAKSAQSGIATTFVSPTPGTYTAWTWYATYYQAP